MTNYDVRAEANPVQSLATVHAFTVTTTNAAGALDFAWDKLDGASSYEIRGRKVTDAAGQYPYSKIITKTRYRGTGFDPKTIFLMLVSNYFPLCAVFQTCHLPGFGIGPS